MQAQLVERFIQGVERVGNRLPHPTLLFMGLSLGLVLLSWLLSVLQVEALHPVSGELFSVNNLVSVDGLNQILGKAVSNFTSFAPVGVVLVMMMGIGVAEHSGLIGAVLGRIVKGTSRAMLAYVIAFAGVMSSLGADVGYVVLIPLAGLIYQSQNRPALAGIAVAFAGVSAGFSANLLIGPVDLILASLSTEAAQLVEPTAVVKASDNYFFIVASTFLISLLCGRLSNHIVEPHLLAKQGAAPEAQTAPTDESPSESLRAAAAFSLCFVALLLALKLFAGEKLSLLGHIVPLLAIFFALAGYCHGRSNGRYQSASDAILGMEQAMHTMAYYLVLMFFAAQFVSYFAWSNIGVIIAIKGAAVLGSMQLPPALLLPLFILLTAVINLLVGSASAKWALLAPVFIPMLMLLGIPPEQTQVAYRVGDSTTNIITPLMPYFGIVLAYAQHYKPNLGLGDIVGVMLPYSLGLLIVWGAFTSLWIGIGLPLGP